MIQEAWYECTFADGGTRSGPIEGGLTMVPEFIKGFLFTQSPSMSAGAKLVIRIAPRLEPKETK